MKSRRTIIISLLLVAIMSLGLFAVGCNNNDGKTDGSDAAVNTDANNNNTDDNGTDATPAGDNTDENSNNDDNGNSDETIASGHAKIDIYQAVTYAETEVPDGIVTEIDVERDDDKSDVTYTVTIERDGEEYEFKYDEASGKLLEKEQEKVDEEDRIDKEAVSITMAQVIETAKSKNKGEIDDIELKKNNDGKYYYKVEFEENSDDEANVEYKIDAMTGALEEYVDR